MVLQVAFGALAGIYTGTYIIMSRQREKRDIYNHLTGGALAGAVASGIFGDFSVKGLSKRIVGVALCAALYSQAVRIQDEAADYKEKYGTDMTSEEIWTSFASVVKEL